MSVFNWLTEAYKAWDRCPIVDPGDTGSIQVRQSGAVHLRSAGVETRTLPRPGAKGTHLFIDMEADGGDITLTVTGGYDEAGDTTFTFSDPGQFLYLVSVYESASGLYEWRRISDYGTGNAALAGLLASVTELNTLHTQNLSVGPAAGITGGTGTVVENALGKQGSMFKTTFFIDLTGLGSSTTDLDIIGQGASAAYLMQLVAADVGATIDAILVQCLEAPAGGVTDIDLYSAVEGTGKFDDAITGLTETALLTSGGAWTNGRQLGATVCPAAGEYLYLTCGAGGTAASYTAGKFAITIYGH